MPSTYTTLKKGAQGASVSGLQNSLRNAGYQLNQSGVFDDATENAVKQYQKQNKLTVDGIAGDQTLNSLYGTGGQNTQYGYTPSANVMNAQKYLESLQANKPAAYQGKYGDQISSLIDQISNRQPFQYDVNTDPLYQMYRDQYITNGQRAMQDTMGQAAAMTGGYGNSYATAAGQQMYNQTLEGLNNIIPQLEQMAYQRYNDEENRMRANAQMLQGMDESEYGRYRDTVGDWLTERQMAENAYQNERNFDYGAMADLRNLEFQREMTEGDREFQREMTNRGYDFQREMNANDQAFQREMTDKGYDFQREMTAGDRDFQREMTNAGYDFQREMTEGDRAFQREMTADERKWQEAMTNLGYDFQREMNANDQNFQREMTDKGYDFQREMTEGDRAFQREMTDAGYDFQREMTDTDYQRNLDAQTKEYAYKTAMAMIAEKKMPSDALLAAAGLSKKDVETWIGPQQQAVAYAYEPTTTTKKSSGSKNTKTNTQQETTPGKLTDNALTWIASQRTPDEYDQRKYGGSTAKDITGTRNFADYIDQKAAAAYEAGKLNKQEMQAIAMYYADFLK